ncbi:Uncharacterized protein PECH_000495 [Penicillium ucsense]|uniref:Uncharacterized protein n=1 Tax=Penicillium ucsense TaxID=2839758 RepID=A0A8J8WL71_9EURO|nr:Uncharacterized protein PECM_004113 [Penicillium ucsense]KAF7733529.1 Uncharacterized protein PECH_000495 [Penicillium ucsense]
MSQYTHHIAILGAGTIGLSTTAMHLRRPDTTVTIFDPRPDAEAQIHAQLPSFLDDPTIITATSKMNTETNVNNPDIPIPSPHQSRPHPHPRLRLRLATSIQDAVQNATIVQEQTPELLSSKQSLWQEVSRFASPTAHLWSSSSGIPASAQAQTCSPSDRGDVQTRLLVVHPFNPPHVMPLVEIVPGPLTRAERVRFAEDYFSEIPAPVGVDSVLPSSSSSPSPSFYRPVTLQKEIPGFVGNRLAFALLREACHLVGEGVVTAQDLDTIVTSSLGPRWAGSGVFESYHAGGGPGGIGAFLDKLAPTIRDVWAQLGTPVIPAEEERGQTRQNGGESVDNGDAKWRHMVVTQTEQAYGLKVSGETRARKEQMLKEVLELQRRNRQGE